MDEETKIAYKLVEKDSDGKLYSWSVLRNAKFLCLEYPTDGTWVKPKIDGTPIFVFDTLENANPHLGPSDQVWKVEYKNVLYKRSEMIDSYFLERARIDLIRSFWVYGRSTRADTFVLVGTMLVDEVKLIELVGNGKDDTEMPFLAI